MTAPYRGTNCYRTHLKAGKIITRRIAQMDGVVGILGNGSIGRQFGDKFSDLDLIVYAHDNHVHEIAQVVSVGWTSYKGIDFDIPTCSYEKALAARVPSKLWSQVTRWDRQNAQILYDAKGCLKDLLDQKLIFPESERKRLIKQYHEQIHEHLVFFPALWAERGQLYNVIDTLIRGVENILLWIYASNRVFEPYMAKWPFYHLETKAVPEHIHLKRLTKMFSPGARTMTQAMEIRENLIDLCREMGIEWEVYSFEESCQRAKANWGKVSDRTRRILSW